ncbi:DNA-(apurinic or apyrimidinic site) lyase 1 [Neolecta irregularis DAH-3]|uniref:Apurinic-apyrimidinic endonuclease 1 n=1 Tax=Neolecta irregularis (strain DAH-3) TaxID=1198029 RepID=A0A1U7LS98_NEOID|nr:DNA-(apurinic or apyrimidinic site) lyase 1 [Neolecta irregularis DAH-3]|eukprot:OLL25537.1 DNA-(apurinic or apyrimidinic site) lyase 1 [Neolecta irregularis DAH-3]
MPPKRKKETPETTRKKAKKPDKALTAQTMNLSRYIGAHVSASGGVQNSVLGSIRIGANAFALFLKSQRKWVSPALKDTDIAQFKILAKEHGFTMILPHGSYLVNLANPQEEMREKSYACFIDDLRRCEALGIKYYNFHPGSNVNREEGVKFLAGNLNRAHRETSSVVLVVENMAGQGNILGGKFEELRDIIANVDDKSRVGVCLDTCHMFAFGYDIVSQYDKVMSDFDEIVGRRYLAAFHLNDSKAACGDKRDLHANIGVGYIGLEPFRKLMNDERSIGIPMILETPQEDEQVWADEIKLLESLIGKQADDPTKAKELSKSGLKDRQAQKVKADKKKIRSG